MSVESHYNDLINSCNNRIATLESTNADLSAQEEIQQELLSQKNWATYYLEKALRNQRNKMYSFLRENGGAFNLNEEQQAYYSQMLTECNSINSNWKVSKAEGYNLTQGVTGLNNKIFSNNLSIFNETLDLGDYRNQLNLFSHTNQMRELG